MRSEFLLSYPIANFVQSLLTDVEFRHDRTWPIQMKNNAQLNLYFCRDHAIHTCMHWVYSSKFCFSQIEGDRPGMSGRCGWNKKAGPRCFP
jgi:hypothetical protein